MKKTIPLLCVIALVCVLGIYASVFQPIINFPANESKINTHYALLNFTANGSILVFANDNSSRLNTKNGLVFINLSQANKTMIYNLTTLPIQSDSEGLVALYHFDNRSEFGENNTVVYDFASNGGRNNGTCTNCPTWNETGKIAGAYEFNGSAFISHPTTGVNIFNGTISMWIKPDTNLFDATEQGLWSTDDSGGDALDLTYMGTADTLFFRWWDGYSVASNTEAVIGDLEADVWHHIVFTWDGTADNTPTAFFYVDGERKDTIERLYKNG